MAPLASHMRVRPDQRKAPRMLRIGHLCHRHPTLDRVALIAIAPELPAMQIRMARRAFMPYILEHQIHMARSARHARMHPAQRIRCFRIVIKLRVLTYGRPG